MSILDRSSSAGGDPTFPCDPVNILAVRCPTLTADNRRLQATGLERWLAEQAERARRGEVGADVRYKTGVEPGQ